MLGLWKAHRLKHEPICLGLGKNDEMALDALTDQIETLKERIRSHRDILGRYKSRTRMALIDPLLQGLGWDVSEPNLVVPEFQVGPGWADYALLGTDGQAVATLEAKRLGEPLDPHRMQMLNYSNAAGIGYAGITNGDRWELYSVFHQAPLQERRLMSVSGVHSGIAPDADTSCSSVGVR